MRSRHERQGFEAGKKKFVSNLKVWRIYEIVSQGVYSVYGAFSEVLLLDFTAFAISEF